MKQKCRAYKEELDKTLINRNIFKIKLSSRSIVDFEIEVNP